MTKIIKKLNILKRGPAQPHFCKSGAGFVILFAVTLSAILLSIALGVANIAFKEIRFGTNARDTNNAFFAADTGAECALFYDKSDPAKNAFIGTATTITCAENSFPTPAPSPANFWKFTIFGLGNGGQGCAIVTVDKTISTQTAIISKGYNTGGNVAGACVPVANSTERQIELNYSN